MDIRKALSSVGPDAERGRELFPKIPECKHQDAVFSYRYASIKSTHLCFDNSKIGAAEYRQYFKAVQKISSITIGDLADASQREYHWHEVDVFQKPDIKRILDRELGLASGRHTAADYPPVFQFCTHVGAPGTAPRIFFFLGPKAIFYLLYFDLEHTIYKGKAPN